MPCISPLKAWHPKSGGKAVFTQPSPRVSSQFFFQHVSCGQCIGCRLQASQQTAVRCMHEKRVHPTSCFLTLTYSKEALPLNESLVKSEVPDFNKRLRRRIGANSNISVFYCGEYGDKWGRPHYHELLFGYLPNDLKFYKRIKGYDYFTSEFLNSVWGLGHVIVGNIDFDSAAYVARYQLKKQKNSDLVQCQLVCPVYGVVYDVRYFDCFFSDIKTRELIKRVPVFAHGSKNPALGQRFVDKYAEELYSSWHAIFKSHQVELPRYYKKLLQKRDPARFAEMWQKSLETRLLTKPLTQDNIRARDFAIKSRMSSLTRSLEL